MTDTIKENYSKFLFGVSVKAVDSYGYIYVSDFFSIITMVIGTQLMQFTEF